jgi:hypothetical protein
MASACRGAETRALGAPYAEHARPFAASSQIARLFELEIEQVYAPRLAAHGAKLRVSPATVEWLVRARPAVARTRCL